MPEKELFEAIRREDVIIFAGAGFSKYAGYPLGGELAAILHATLPADLQAEISPQLPLDYLTEEIVRKMGGSRDFLNETLDNIFTAAPISLTDHEAVASIPHFQTIITTNYDSLFEQAYGMRANTIFRNDQVSTWDDKKANTIKIHGDLSDKETIILTREDYSRPPAVSSVPLQPKPLSASR